MSGFFEALKFARNEYKKHKILQRQKKKLLSAKSDFTLLEELIKQCNKNENLRVSITLNDGTQLNLSTSFKPQKRTVSDLITVGMTEGEEIYIRYRHHRKAVLCSEHSGIYPPADQAGHSPVSA